MECFKYAFNILTVSDGIYSINPGGLQADLMGGVRGGRSPPVNINRRLGGESYREILMLPVCVILSLGLWS